jgi:hypothetical protein
MSDQEETSIIRAILRSELTWGIFLIGALMGFVSTVVLPIQKLQIQVTQIQLEITHSLATYDQIIERLSDIEKEHVSLETRIK